MFKFTNKKATSANFDQNLNLNIEALEKRTLLSGVQIFAAGDLGGEEFALQIDGQTVQQFTATQELSAFEFQTDQPITAGQVSIAFLNDQFDPTNGIDANLTVDAIEIDGVRFETEDPSVFSTGTFTDADGIVPGFGRGETLHTNGFFQFADSSSSGLLEISARGDVGGEQFNVLVAGETVGTFTASTEQQSFFVDAAPGTTAGDVRIEFINDQFDPSIGLDSNLTVDFISIDGETFQTEAGNVFSTGTFLSEDGIVDGFGRGETLNANGFFQFADDFATGPDGTISVAPEGFSSANFEAVSDADGEGPGVAFLFDDASGDLNFLNVGELDGLGQAAATTVEAGDGIRLAGPGSFDGSIVNLGELTSESNQGTTAGFRSVNGLDFQGTLVNADGATISGANNGVYFGTGDNSGEFINNGTVTSDSRAVNIDGDGLTVINNGDILGTGDQRNGTVYSDNTASNFEFINSSTGLVDAGLGNNGAAVSLSLNDDGSNGDITVFNGGTLAGRGQASAADPTAGDGIRLEGNRGPDGVPPGLFEGDIVNSGLITSDSAQGTTGGFRAVNGLDFQGLLFNDGQISGVQNGVYFGTGDHDGSLVVNEGLISSDSRAFNIDGEGLVVVNDGAILGTGDQRNGTIYSDNTASDFEILNRGLVDAGLGNDGAAVSLSLNNDGSNGEISLINEGSIAGRGQAAAGLATAGDGIRLEGARTADGIPPGIFEGEIINSGSLTSDSAQGTTGAFRAVNGLGFQGELVNTGLIDGVQNGVYFGTGDHADGIVVNQGTIASDSRAVNIDGDGLELVNEGLITGTGDQRNGTVYVDGTADNFDIVNLEGLIDAGSGNNGSGLAIETGDTIGDQVNGLVFNSGAIQGQGNSDVANQIGHGLRFIGGAGTDGTAVFTGDIVNTGTIAGSADSDLAAGISVENVGLSQSIVNSGLITGSSIAVDASSATSSISLINEGTIDGDVLFGSSDDVLTVSQFSSISGVVDGGAGFDTLNVEFDSFDAGVAFTSSIDISNFEAIFISGQRFV